MRSGGFSTLGDLDRFLTALADGTLLGSLTEEMLAPDVWLGDGFAHGYGVLHHPDGSYGHGGGDPGVEVFVRRFPGEDANQVVLCNTHGWADDLRDAVLHTRRGSGQR